MDFKLIITKEAQEEILDAIEWYKNKAPHLDKELQNCLEYGFSLIRKTPKMFPIIHKEYRRSLVSRFPYQIIYIVRNTSIIIIAVFHAKRDPKKWQKR